jgi:hypothetical protein
VPATEADLELAKRVAPVLADEDLASGAPVSRREPAASEKTAPNRGGSGLMWLIWVVVIVLVGMMSRRMLRSGSAAH